MSDSILDPQQLLTTLEKDFKEFKYKYFGSSSSCISPNTEMENSTLPLSSFVQVNDQLTYRDQRTLKLTKDL